VQSSGNNIDPESAVQSAKFSLVTGKFASASDEDWWEQRGLPSDRAGRQMAAYFDVDAYQEQMRESKRQKIAEGKSQPKLTKKMLDHFKKKKEDKKRKRLLMM